MTEPTPPAAVEVPTWPLSVFRLVASIEAVLVFNQAVLAGRFLGGEYGAVGLHAQNATIAAGVMVLEVVAAVLLWLHGRGPAWLIGACAALTLAIGAQIGLGYAHEIGLHIPLGVTIVVLTVLLLVWSWRFTPEPAESRPAAEPAAEPAEEPAGEPTTGPAGEPAGAVEGERERR